jgi:hypothetical protein
MECSVKSTEILFSTTALHQRDEIVALARCHPGSGLVHEQEMRIVGERDRKLDTLDVPVGELLASPAGHRNELSFEPTCFRCSPPQYSVFSSKNSLFRPVGNFALSR